MRKVFVIFGFMLIIGSSTAQETDTIQTFDDLMSAVETIRTTESIADRQSQIDALWDELIAAGRIPFIDGENVVFLYRGEARSVDWIGDFNGFATTGGVKGEPIEGTNLWISATRFPMNARFEYGILLDRNPTQVVQDLANPLQRPGLYGGILSELRMPEYVLPDAVVRRPDIPRGTLTDNIIIESAVLGYSLAYRVYTPSGYEDLNGLASIYALDGETFINDDFGALPIVLDNLIADGQMSPAIAVFIDARDPENLRFNRRNSQLTENSLYAQFITEELVPAVDAVYKTDTDAASRAIIGGSFGGVGAFFMGAVQPDIFGNIGSFSAPLSYITRSIRLYREAPEPSVNVFIVSGRPEWDVDLSTVAGFLDMQGYLYQYLVDEGQGHSFITWRDALDQVLPYFFPANGSAD
jgi:enterochelin esterase family protein